MNPALTPAAATRTTLFSFTGAVLISATSSAPTPLYPLYRTLFHLSPPMLTLVFGAYAFALLAALLTVGKVSDFTGRRPLMLLAMALLPLIPETITPQPGVLAALHPQVSIPRRALGPLLKVTPVNIATWMLGGFYLSLMPGMVASATGLTSPLVGGSVVATLMLSATAAVLLFRLLPPARALVIGTLMLITGVTVTLTGLSLHSVAWLYVGTAIAGQGFGSIFSSVLKIILPLAEGHERAGLFAAFLVKSYLAFALPAIAAGIAAPHIGLNQTAWYYGMTLIALALMSLLAVKGRAFADAPGA